jgi:hypothetical protein
MNPNNYKNIFICVEIFQYGIKNVEIAYNKNFITDVDFE